MTSKAFKTFENAIQDSLYLMSHFDTLNKKPPSPELIALKRAGLVMALAALETYVEDGIVEAADKLSGCSSEEGFLVRLYKSSLDNELKYFHTPSADRVMKIFQKYLGVNISEGWTWNNYDPARASKELDLIVKKRGEIAHRSLCPVDSYSKPHIVTRDDLRKHIRFITDFVTVYSNRNILIKNFRKKH